MQGRVRVGGIISSRRRHRGGHYIRHQCQSVAADPRAAAASRGTGISISSMSGRGGHHTQIDQYVAAEPRAAPSFRRTGSSTTGVIRREWYREATDFTQI